MLSDTEAIATVAMKDLKAAARFYEGKLTDAITALKQQSGKNIGVHGSPRLVEPKNGDYPVAQCIN